MLLVNKWESSWFSFLESTWQVYYAYEENDACARSCEGKDRGFILHVIDNSGRVSVSWDTSNAFIQEVMRIIREYNECAGCCGGSYVVDELGTNNIWNRRCAGSGSTFSHQVTVEAPPDNIVSNWCSNDWFFLSLQIGTVCQCASSTMYSYEISDQDGKVRLFISNWKSSVFSASSCCWQSRILQYGIRRGALFFGLRVWEKIILWNTFR